MTLRSVSAVAFGVALLTTSAPAAVPSGGVPRDVSVAVAAVPLGARLPVAAASSRTAAQVPEVEVTEMDVVVPAVEASGDVVATPDVVEAQADPDAIVTDEVVAADRVESAVVEAGDFQTLGVTWPGDAQVDDLGLEVRTRSDGQWTEWTVLEPADDAPDVGTVDAASAVRGGTDALWVGDADAVQLAFAATTQSGPDGLSLALITSAETTTAPDDAIVGAPQPDAGTAAVETASHELVSFPTASFETAVRTDATATAVSTAAAPTVITRAEWGARAQVCTPDVASKLVGSVVHHTAGSNSYSTVDQAKQQIRNDQRYHIESRGWCDIGYNFIVDKWGNIYEGRANSLTKPVIGVHAGGFNTGTVGVSMLGNYSDIMPSAATQRSVAQIIGWRLGAYGINPEGSMSYYTYGGQNTRFPTPQRLTLPRVFGHRDVAFTACPGNTGQHILPAVRTMGASFSYAQRFGIAGSVVRALYEDFLHRGVDPTGMETWSGLFASGAGGPALVDGLTNSDEYVNLRIRDAYRQVLGRAPEPGGAEHWYTEIRAGRATVDDVMRHFLSSAEFRLRSGGTDDGYVRRLFASVLGRTPADAEVRTWVATITSIGRERVTDQLWFSQEAAERRAAVYYRMFLKRDAEAAGKVFWAKVLLTQGEGAVRIGIAGSDEYRDRALVRFP